MVVVVDEAHGGALLQEHFGARFAASSLSVHVATLEHQSGDQVNGGEPVVLVFASNVELRVEGPAPEPGELRTPLPGLDGDVVAVFDLASGDFIQASSRAG